MGAIVAIIHDVTITVGIFSIFDKEFTLPIVAALLTIVGYSLNDTIIVFDRIRENLRKQSKSPLQTIINSSINETLSRTILTSGTTMLVLLALFIWGGGIIHDFAMTLMVGEMRYKFDPHLLRVFMKCMAIQPLKVLKPGETIQVM